jgi:hypothetical protein
MSGKTALWITFWSCCSAWTLAAIVLISLSVAVITPQQYGLHYNGVAYSLEQGACMHRPPMFRKTLSGKLKPFATTSVSYSKCYTPTCYNVPGRVYTNGRYWIGVGQSFLKWPSSFQYVEFSGSSSIDAWSNDGQVTKSDDQNNERSAITKGRASLIPVADRFR